MTPAERRALLRLANVAGRMTPEFEAALRASFDLLRQAIGEQAWARAIANGSYERLIADVLSDAATWNAYGPVREQIARSVDRVARAATAAIPPRTLEIVGVQFDTLAPQVVDAIRTLQTKQVDTLAEGVRETFRQHILSGVEAGHGPAKIAKGLREIVPLAPNQEEYIRNYERALREGRRGKALGYQLRDKRFDASVRAGKLTPERIDRMVAAYRQRMVNYNAMTHARTAALESSRLGQHMAWQQARDSGALGEVRVLKKWVHNTAKDFRPEHKALDGTEVDLSVTYPNGDEYPGQGDPWNCRCTETYRVVPLPQPL